MGLDKNAVVVLVTILDPVFAVGRFMRFGDLILLAQYVTTGIAQPLVRDMLFKTGLPGAFNMLPYISRVCTTISVKQAPTIPNPILVVVGLVHPQTMLPQIG
jgi:hypothetical protein